MNIRHLLGACILLLIGATSSFAQDDMPGTSDHPEFPRIAGSTIAGYSQTTFDEAPYLKGTEDDFTQFFAAGEVTKLLYVLPVDQSTASAFLNYEKVFQDLGTFEPHYTCRRGTCHKDLATRLIWREENRFETTIRNPNTYFFGFPQLQINEIYLSGEIKAETGTFTVAVYAAEATRDRSEFAEGQTIAILQIVKTEAFKADLEVVEADEIGSEITKSGHVTLSGLFFETNKDVLEASSKPALDEIANFLTTSSDTNVYIVGHTDNVGDVAYNQDLSLRRAASIAKNLADEYGIDKDRITPLGAGLAAPVATNKTEEGRALNRRVELVER